MSSDIYKKLHKIINKEFLVAGAAKLTEESVKLIYDNLPEYSEIVDPNSPLKKYDDKIHKMYHFLKNHFSDQVDEVSFAVVRACAFVLGYLVQDVDIIPDYMSEVGELDDALLVKVMIELYPEEFSL
jgi:uncharacterized membrane protein YkvA (DUF1232 family)